VGGAVDARVLPGEFEMFLLQIPTARTQCKLFLPIGSPLFEQSKPRAMEEPTKEKRSKKRKSNKNNSTAAKVEEETPSFESFQFRRSSAKSNSESF
jgi:hypothetical protein